MRFSAAIGKSPYALTGALGVVHGVVGGTQQHFHIRAVVRRQATPMLAPTVTVTSPTSTGSFRAARIFSATVMAAF